ncbi:MAG: hypothetical protein ABIZ72_09015, partial [Candidatus Limnocylindrales bacterium]
MSGVVTAEAGRLGTPALIAIQDATGGIAVRLGDSAARPALGTVLELTGTVADPYGQLEIRAVSAFRRIGSADLPAPVPVDGSNLDDAVEGRLVSLEGVAVARPTRATSGDIVFDVTTAHGPVRIAADASSGLTASAVAKGDRLRLIGIAGQRASRKGAADGFRVWLRGPADVLRLGGATGSATPPPSASGSPSTPPGGAIRTIAAAILAGSGTVTIEGSVTAPAALLDATHRRIVVQDRTAAVEVLLASGSTAPPVGARIRVTGESGRAYGAPRIRAATIDRIGTAVISALELRVAPGAAHEWRLIRVRGDVVEVHRSGERWTAELLVGGTRVPITGLGGAAIPSAALATGRTATVVGIVRRPYPSASDRRFSIVPRSPGDLTVGGPADDPADARNGNASGASASGPAHSARPGSGGDDHVPPTIDLIDLIEHLGSTVRVGGLVQALEDDGFRLDDGTAVATVRLRSVAADLVGSIVVGDALSATGRIELEPGRRAPLIVIEDPAGIALVGDLGSADANGSDGASDGGGPSSAPAADATAPGGGSGGPIPGSDIARTAGLAGLPGLELGGLGLILLSVASLAVT